MSLRVNFNILNQKGTPAFYSDTFANRPAAGFAGRVFISTNTGEIYEDTGSTWTLIADAGAGTTGTLQQVTTNGNTTTQGITITAGGLSSNTVSVIGGTDSQFLKANGSLDSNTYLTTGSASSTYVPYSGATGSVNLGSNNISANAFFNKLNIVTASGTQVVLTISSAPVQLVTGSGGQTFKLPDATTLSNGTIFSFNNNQSSGAITVNNNSNTLVASIPSGGYTTVVLLDNSTAAGSWDRHDQTPANVSWSTNTLDYAGSITSATWNGNVIAINRGGTGSATQNFVDLTTNQSIAGRKTFNPSITASGAIAQGSIFSPTLTAAANGDVLSAVYINPTFTNGAFTGVSNNGLIVANGNVGIGATPSGLWSNLWSVSQLGQAISLFSYKSGSNYGGIINNTYSVGGSYQTGNARYINNGYALSYIQSNSGEHIWLSAASGTAGDVVTWSQSMTINASGYLGIGLSTIGSKLQVNGNAAIGYSSSTAAPTNGLAVSGNLGIGTTSPFAILTSVAPNLGAIGLGIVGRPSDDFGLITFRKNDATTTVLEIGGNIANGFFIKNYADTFTYFSTNATERMRITSGGKVLIGTTTDNSQGTLQNNGTFYTLGLAMGGTTFSTNTTATYTNVFYYFNGGTGITLTLPAANAKSNYYIIKNGSANALTIAANGSDTFIAAGTIVTVSTLTLASGASTTIICNGTVNWIQIS